MPATATVTYSAQGSPDTILIFDLIGADVNYIHRELPLKKNELDEKFNVDLRKVPLISTMLQSRQHEASISDEVY